MEGLRLVRSDPNSIAVLLEGHEPALQRYVRRLVGNAEDAEDIAQEALLRMVRTHERVLKRSGRAKPNLTGWLYTIARNLCIDHLRRRRERAASDAEIATTASREPTPPAIYERAVELDTLRKALQKLPTHYREILDLRFSEGLSYRDIGARLGVPITTVEARLHRARRMLRRVLGGAFHG
jgi:RNA polymerase sigma-70 factor (ECF subfamily)